MSAPEIKHYPVPKREPIVLTHEGDALLPRKGLGGDGDAILADICAGEHAVCGGSVTCCKTTVSGTVILFCKRCGMRLVYPSSVATFGDLRSQPLEEFAPGAGPRDVRCAKPVPPYRSNCSLSPGHDGDCHSYTSS